MKAFKLTLLTVFSTLALSLAPAVVFAGPTTPAPAGGTPQSDACDALHQLDSTKDCSSGGNTGVTNIVSAIVTILSIIVGIAAVIMIIIAALKYVTASGDAGAISSAKSTLIYALIGLFIAALAQFLVHFVISTANKA